MHIRKKYGKDQLRQEPWERKESTIMATCMEDDHSQGLNQNRNWGFHIVVISILDNIHPMHK